MRAVVFSGPGQFSLEDVPDPIPGPRDVLVRVEAVGICGTDIHVLDGEFAPTVFPIIPGHETSGVVEAVGEEVTKLAPGDQVSVDPTLTCGECSFCSVGRGNLCENWNGAGVARTNGSTAELMVMPVGNVHRLASEVDVALAATIEPLSCAIRGYDLLPRRMGDHYLVYGAGTMGLLMAQLAPRAGAASVTIVDINERRLETATELGIQHVLTNADDAGREKWDVVIDCTGSIRAIENALPRVKAGGTFQHFGVAPVDATAQYSPFRVYRDEISIVGTMAVLNSFGRAVEMFEAGAINPKPMISHSFTLDDYADALQMFRDGIGRKLQIRPNDTESRTLLASAASA